MNSATLTGAYNRLYFDNVFKSEIDRVKRYNGTFSIIYFDIDNFKSINDKFGHSCGDKILTSLVKIIQQLNRQSDSLIRYGGEEFIILATNANKEGAEIHANRIRKYISAHNFDSIDQLTCSFGVAEFDPKVGNHNDLIKRADSALYKAKETGRNKVIVA